MGKYHSAKRNFKVTDRGEIMELKTCKNCRRLYNHFVGQNLCPSCMTQLDEIYRKVKEYVYDHPNVTIQEVADEFDISIKTIHGWIREERLEFGSMSSVGLPCEVCGVTIKSGKYCGTCKKTLVESLSSVYRETPVVKGPEEKKKDTKMRFIK